MSGGDLPGRDRPRGAGVPPDRWLRAGRDERLEERSLPLELAAGLLFRTILALSLYLLVAGHGSTGGGFAGGLVAGIAFVLRYVAGGPRELRAAAGGIDPGVLLGAGLLLVLGTGAAAWLFGEPFASSAVVHLTVPIFDEVKLVSSLLLDVGIYLLVLGVVLDMSRLLGSRGAPEAEVPEGLELR